MSESPTIQVVKEKYANDLLEKPGVVSVGIGLDPEGNPAIVLGVDSDQARSAEALPETLEGYRVIKQVIGPIKAQ